MTNNNKYRSYYYKVVKLLLDNCNSKHPISIRRVSLPPDLCGECWYDSKKKKFFIRVNKKLSISNSVDTIIHEVAHCESFWKDKDDHGRNWGIAYSRVYRIYEKKFLM